MTIHDMHRMRFQFGNHLDPLSEEQEQRLFESAMRALESEIMSIGLHLSIDSEVRSAYRSQTDLMSSDLRRQVKQGRISWKMAAKQAQEIRNIIMEISRTHSTPVGRAYAEHLKPAGKTFDDLIDKNCKKLFGERSDFHKLEPPQKNQVYAAIVKSSGSVRAGLSGRMQLAGHAGRGLIVISLAMSVYTVTQAEDKVSAAGKEVAVTGAGIGGAISGGAMAGLACGPAAPICVSIGAFVGGALAAFGTSLFW